MGPPAVKAELEVRKLREGLKQGNIYRAIKGAIAITENKMEEDTEEIAAVLYSEVNWGTFFMILDKYPDKERMELYLYPVHYKDMPVLLRGGANLKQGEFNFIREVREGDDYMLIGEGIMTDYDAWFDSFLAGRYFDTSDKQWEQA